MSLGRELLDPQASVTFGPVDYPHRLVETLSSTYRPVNDAINGVSASPAAASLHPSLSSSALGALLSQHNPSEPAAIVAIPAAESTASEHTIASYSSHSIHALSFRFDHDLLSSARSVIVAGPPAQVSTAEAPPDTPRMASWRNNSVFRWFQRTFVANPIQELPRATSVTSGTDDVEDVGCAEIRVAGVIFAVVLAILGVVVWAGVALHHGPDRSTVGGLRLLAEAGDVDSQHSLALRYLHGTGVEQSYNESVMWLRRATERGSAAACTNLGVCVFNGWGVEANFTEAAQLWTVASEQGIAFAQYQLSLSFQHGEGVARNETYAMELLRGAAEGGSEEAMVELANGNLPYHYRVYNYSEAVYWYTRAESAWTVNGTVVPSSTEFSNVLLYLGDYFWMGKGVPRDLAKGLSYYRRAADLGSQEAQVELGDCYMHGDGVQQDSSEARLWYQKAAEQGSLEAMIRLGLELLSVESNSSRKAEGVAWYRKAVEAGQSALPLMRLSDTYRQGWDRRRTAPRVEVNMTESEYWDAEYKRAALEQGLSTRRGNLGYLLSRDASSYDRTRQWRRVKPNGWPPEGKVNGSGSEA